MWGSDYPHIEGTFPNSVLSLRHALEGVESEEFIRAVLGENAATVYGFDLKALQTVADRIGPTMDELRAPVNANELPTESATAGFRLGTAPAESEYRGATHWWSDD